MYVFQRKEQTYGVIQLKTDLGSHEEERCMPA